MKYGRRKTKSRNLQENWLRCCSCQPKLYPNSHRSEESRIWWKIQERHKDPNRSNHQCDSSSLEFCDFTRIEIFSWTLFNKSMKLKLVNIRLLFVSFSETTLQAKTQWKKVLCVGKRPLWISLFFIHLLKIHTFRVLSLLMYSIVILWNSFSIQIKITRSKRLWPSCVLHCYCWSWYSIVGHYGCFW